MSSPHRSQQLPHTQGNHGRTTRARATQKEARTRSPGFFVDVFSTCVPERKTGQAIDGELIYFRFGWAVVRKYGLCSVNEPNSSVACSLSIATGMITSSPSFQSTGVATLC